MTTSFALAVWPQTGQESLQSLHESISVGMRFWNALMTPASLALAGQDMHPQRLCLGIRTVTMLQHFTCPALRLQLFEGDTLGHICWSLTFDGPGFQAPKFLKPYADPLTHSSCSAVWAGLGGMFRNCPLLNG